MSHASSPHRRMLGARLVARLPGLQSASWRLEAQPQGLFLLWLAYMGLLASGAWLMWWRGVWAMLLQADPTGLTLAILLVFVAGSLWVGQRAWRLGQQRAWVLLPPRQRPAHSWGQRFDADCQRWDLATARDLLAERCQGAHEMGWWVNGILVKLGLLGKVIGFSILAFELGHIESFDPAHTAQVLKSLTGGLGVALLTTMTGLAANMLLGVQLMRLDRYGDALIMDLLSPEPGDGAP